MTQMVHADQVVCSYMFRLKQNTMSTSKQNRKDIHTQKLKNPKPSNLAQTTQQTQSFNHKASAKRSRAVNIKWWRERCAWHRFKLGSVSSPLLIRRTCHLKTAG